MHRGRSLIALLLALMALLPVACGDDSGGRPLSRTAASELRAGLDSVKQNIDAGDCQAAADSALELEQRAMDLPRRVDPDLRDALQDGVARLGELVREQCQADQTDEGTTAPVAPPTTDTGPTGTETTPSDEGNQDENGKEKPSKPGKGKKKDENGGTTTPPSDTPPLDGGSGQDFGSGNPNSGGAEE
jgi:hypothetical protein